MFCGYPAGGVLAGLLSAPLIPAFGWSVVFVIGGVLPLLLLPALWRSVPESAQFLTATGDLVGLRRVLHRLGSPVDVVLGAAGTAALGYAGSQVVALLLLTFVAGFGGIGGQMCMVAVCANFYETSLRATGLGSTIVSGASAGLPGRCSPGRWSAPAPERRRCSRSPPSPRSVPRRPSQRSGSSRTDTDDRRQQPTRAHQP
jgi:MFS family permease